MICNKTVYPTSFSLRGVVSGNNELRGHFLAAPIILLITPLPQSSKWNQDRNLHPPPTPPPPPPPPPCDTPSTTSPFLFCFSLCRPVVGLKRWPRCFLREEDGRSFLWGHSAAGVRSAVVFYSSLLMSVFKVQSIKEIKVVVEHLQDRSLGQAVQFLDLLISWLTWKIWQLFFWIFKISYSLFFFVWFPKNWFKKFNILALMVSSEVWIHVVE